jgi:hypothetical protein
VGRAFDRVAAGMAGGSGFGAALGVLLGEDAEAVVKVVEVLRKLEGVLGDGGGLCGRNRLLDCGFPLADLIEQLPECISIRVVCARP